MARPFRYTIRTLNHVVQPVDELLAPCTWAGAPPLFLLGSPRSGTTLAYQLLAQAFKVTYLPRAVNLTPGLTHACFRLFSTRLRKAPTSLRSDKGRTPGLFGPSEAIGFWTPWMDEHGQRMDGPANTEAALARAVQLVQGHLKAPLMVKCVYLVQAIDLLARALPDVRFIHLKRASVPAIASLYRVRYKSNSDWWSVRPPGAERASDSPLLDQCVWQHFAIDAMVREALSALEHERSRTLVYEDLCRDPADEVEEIRHWLAPVGWKVRKDWSPPTLAPSDRVDPELEKKIRESPEFRNA